MSVAWLHLRSAPARHLVVPFLVVGLLVLFVRTDYWVGFWPETGGAVSVCAYFLGLLAAASSAWISARGDASGARALAATTSVRPTGRAESARVAAHLVWIALSFVALSVVPAFMTWRSGPPAGVSFFLAYLLAAATMLLLASAWGWLVGRLLSPVVAASVAGLGWVIIAALLSSSSGAFPISGPSWLLLDPTVLFGRCAAVLLVVALVALIPDRRAHLARFRLTATGAGVAMALVLTAVATTTLLVPRPAPENPLCVQGKIRYCLWPENSANLPLIRAQDARVASLPAGLVLPERVVDYGMSQDTVVIDGIEHEVRGDFPPEINILEGNRWSLADSLAGAITQETFAACAAVVDDDPDHPTLQLQGWLERRLAGGGTPDYSTNAPADLQAAFDAGARAASLDEAGQHAWAQATIEGYRAGACRDA